MKQEKKSTSIIYAGCLAVPNNLGNEHFLSLFFRTNFKLFEIFFTKGSEKIVVSYQFETLTTSFAEQYTFVTTRLQNYPVYPAHMCFKWTLNVLLNFLCFIKNFFGLLKWLFIFELVILIVKRIKNDWFLILRKKPTARGWNQKIRWHLKDLPRYI